MKRSKGKLTGKTRCIGKNSKPLKVTDIIKEFSLGDKVVIKIKGNYHKGVPHPRYMGKIGKIVEVRGKSYVLEIKDGKKNKELIASAVHLEKSN
ncbi:MAG: 50S ribosomal protein L21e [Candidatus Micrarchaeia archaeon]|jgi:large subunit ribosomal protein L21e